MYSLVCLFGFAVGLVAGRLLTLKLDTPHEVVLRELREWLTVEADHLLGLRVPDLQRWKGTVSAMEELDRLKRRHGLTHEMQRLDAATQEGE